MVQLPSLLLGCVPQGLWNPEGSGLGPCQWSPCSVVPVLPAEAVTLSSSRAPQIMGPVALAISCQLAPGTGHGRHSPPTFSVSGFPWLCGTVWARLSWLQRMHMYLVAMAVAVLGLLPHVPFTSPPTQPQLHDHSTAGPA